ncbi:hypothetical protein GCM10022419_046360 [Nonomuraea rosea]|uniref:Uncharacterized protein n=1 Tax=Nonomuraea rosea TaxID=638574 RepID=A0ABP6X2G5_9ACTN
MADGRPRSVNAGGRRNDPQACESDQAACSSSMKAAARAGAQGQEAAQETQACAESTWCASSAPAALVKYVSLSGSVAMWVVPRRTAISITLTRSGFRRAPTFSPAALARWRRTTQSGGDLSHMNGRTRGAAHTPDEGPIPLSRTTLSRPRRRPAQ